MINIKDAIRARLVKAEGRTNKPYIDTVGKITIGVGWNLSDKGLPDDIVEDLLNRSIVDAIDEAQKIPVFAKLNPPRKVVIIEMVFNMGLHNVLGFRNTLDMINRGDFAGAAQNMLKSKWAEQVGNRAVELARIMQDGEIKNAPDLVE